MLTFLQANWQLILVIYLAIGLITTIVMRILEGRKYSKEYAKHEVWEYMLSTLLGAIPGIYLFLKWVLTRRI